MIDIGDRDTGDFGGSIRRLWPREAYLLCEHLLRLDPESRRNRFGSPVNRFFIEQYAARALATDAIVHGFLIDGTLRAAAELRPFGRYFPTDAEAAFSVEARWQNGGIGSALLERTLLAARNRGIRTLHMSCLAGNRRMQSIARKYTAELRFDADEVIGAVENSGPTPLSLWREFVSEGQSYASAVLDVHARMLRPR